MMGKRIKENKKVSSVQMSYLSSRHTTSTATTKSALHTTSRHWGTSIGLLTLAVLDGLIDRQDQASRFDCSSQSIGLDQSGLPYESLKVILGSFSLDINTVPFVT
jgi:hypothetical protein